MELTQFANITYQEYPKQMLDWLSFFVTVSTTFMGP